MNKIFNLAVVVSVFFLISMGWLVRSRYTGNYTVNETGDLSGVANAIFSFLAFAVLILTLWSQQKELDEQSKMIQKQSETLEVTRTILAKSAILNSYTIEASQGTSFVSQDTISKLRSELEQMSLPSKGVLD